MPPHLVFDFDGVLVDGMEEYWWSARRAIRRLQPDLPLPLSAPPGFGLLRPQIHKGWEMVLMAAELSRPDFDVHAACADYPAALADALVRHGQPASALQDALECVRRQAIADDLPGWLALHHFYPGVRERLARLEQEGSGWSVLTTKGGAFASQLLAAAGLQPRAVHGHERGSKPEVLRELLAAGEPLWFIEDRRPTLELVRASDDLDSVRCYLVAWGYLAPGDAEGLPAGIALLERASFESPLAQWPASAKVQAY
ncbi:MAG: HAD family hydrolase [Synechococcaceae cyanobacterium]|nr:HAD family hydrolase [Synechococcaceae cyanobacterium]